MASRRKKTPDDYYALAEQRGFRWLGPEVATTKTLTTWECPRGHRWQAIYNNIQQGRHCPQCSRRKRPSDFHLVAEKRGYVWLGPEVTSMDALTGWQCQNAHSWKATYREILRGDSCPDCQNEEEQRQIGIISTSEEFDFTERQEEVEVGTEESITFDADELLSSPLQLDWWDSRAIKYLLQFFSQAKFLIRFSTGFFSIPGYNLIRPAVEKKRVNVLVGYDERSRQELRDLLIDEIMDDLSRWHANRYEVVKHLIDKIRSNEFILLDARTRRRDHSKIFIFDKSYVVGGSINLTRNGLISNAEADLAITAEREPDRVNKWIEKFESYWNAPDTEDLTEKLLERLLAFLSLRRPWDIYLKTIQALAPREKPRSPRPSYRMPVEYQMVVVNRALRQLSNHHGAMVVASTGLGKTIIGTHIAYVLQHVEQRILNVMVIAPSATKKEWRRRLRSAGISADAVYTRDNLDRRLNKDRNQEMLKELLEALKDVDDRWLIIVDESQYFRNRERSGGGERLSFSRLIEVTQTKKCLVLLLTATPYSTELDNINHQLLLIPHTQPKKRTHQIPFPGYETGKEYLNAWRVEHVDELIKLPVATVISTAYVAQNFSVSSKNGDYLLFGEERRVQHGFEG